MLQQTVGRTRVVIPRTRLALRVAMGVFIAGGFASQTALAQKAALVQGIDEPGRTPFALQNTNSTASPYFVQFTVPANQRYVVETYTAECDVATTNAMTSMSISGTTGGKSVTLRTAPHFVQSNGFIGSVAVNFYGGTGAGPLYADPGSTITMFASNRTGASDFKTCFFSVGGHAITNP